MLSPYSYHFFTAPHYSFVSWFMSSLILSMSVGPLMNSPELSTLNPREDYIQTLTEHLPCVFLTAISSSAKQVLNYCQVL